MAELGYNIIKTLLSSDNIKRSDIKASFCTLPGLSEILAILVQGNSSGSYLIYFIEQDGNQISFFKRKKFESFDPLKMQEIDTKIHTLLDQEGFNLYETSEDKYNHHFTYRK